MHLTIKEARLLGFSIEKRAPRILAKYEGKETNIEIPESINGVTITTIGPSCFESTSIEHIVIPNTVNGIGRRAFAHTKLKEVNIPESVGEISMEAFWNCELTSVTFNNTGILHIRAAAFADNLIEELDLTKGQYTVEGAAFNTNALKKVSFKECVFGDNPFPNNPYVKFYTEDGKFTTGKDNNYIVQICIQKDIIEGEQPGNDLISGNQSGEIPHHVDTLRPDAFRGQQIKEFNPPTELKFIHVGALAQCGLGVIELPDSLESIHHMAFGTDSAVLPIIKANQGTYAHEAALRYGWLGNKDKPTSTLTGSNIFR